MQFLTIKIQFVQKFSPSLRLGICIFLHHIKFWNFSALKIGIRFYNPPLGPILHTGLPTIKIGDLDLTSDVKNYRKTLLATTQRGSYILTVDYETGAESMRLTSAEV